MKIAQYRKVLEVAQRDHVRAARLRAVVHRLQDLRRRHPELVPLVVAHELALRLGAQHAHAGGDAELVTDIWRDPHPVVLRVEH